VAQFRTTADVLDEILDEVGEVTNGNSQYETAVLTAANHVHNAIIAGGSIFDVTVDEPWVWARSPRPIVLELETAYTTGTFSATAGSTAISFSSAPAASLEGWHIQANGKASVYKITNHTAAVATAQLDSGFMDSTSSSYAFKAFKIDYEVMPAYLYIDSNNDRIDFQETAATTLSTTLTHGTYTPAGLLTHIVTQLGSTGTASYGGSYNTVLHTFNITASVATKFYGLSGPNPKRSALPLLGFDRIDYTGAQSYTSTYTPNQIARLIEPFRVFTQDHQPFIYSADPIRMQEDYPLSAIVAAQPERFCRMTEDASGALSVRFSHYPSVKMKVQLDWIPQPLDLKDNTASFVLLPRSDMRTFIYAVAAYILQMKEDSKFELYLNMARTGLQAMQKKNRALLFRTGDSFGQIVPRQDLLHWRRRLKYGYSDDGA
jgi:hypothetical protein